MNEFSFKRVFTNVKNNLKINRSLPALIFTITCILAFLSTMLPISSAEDAYVASAVSPERYKLYLEHMEYAWDSVLSINGTQAAIASIAAVGIAFLCVSNLGSWARDKKSLDFWCSAPLTRREHLVSTLVSGFLYFFVSIVPSWYLSLIISWSTITVKPLGLAEILITQTVTLLFVLLFYITILATAVFAVTVAGSVISSLVVFGTALGYPALIAIFTGFVSTNVFKTSLLTTIEHDWRFFVYSSPVLRYAFSGTRTYPMSGVFDYLYFVVWAAVFIALALFLVKKRQSELCQKSLIFPWLRNPIQYMWTFLFTLFTAWFLYVITYDPVWFVIGAVIGAILSSASLNTVFERTFNGAFKNFRKLPIFSVVFALITVVFVADAFGIYKDPTPNFDKVYEFTATVYTRDVEGEEIIHRDASVWSDPDNAIDSEAKRALIKELWESVSKTETPIENDSECYASISIMFWCEDDPSPWYAHAMVYDYNLSDDVFSRFSSLMECFESSFSENKEPVLKEDESTSVIGGADHPTSITVY